MASSERSRRRRGMSVVGVALSLAAAVQHAGREGSGGHADDGRMFAEIVVTESLGSFRNIARVFFLVAAAVDSERVSGG